ncbi:polyprenyl synthetase family protein, partial [Candidatus Pelagibacter sp.]|nr:polyprenyl synthetase family protein [Candidatus Pelagibacter sp.]
IAGKTTGKDKKKGKATLISLLGYQNAIKYSDKIKSKIINDLRKYSLNIVSLNETLDYILTRKK